MYNGEDWCTFQGWVGFQLHSVRQLGLDHEESTGRDDRRWNHSFDFAMFAVYLRVRVRMRSCFVFGTSSLFCVPGTVVFDFFFFVFFRSFPVCFRGVERERDFVLLLPLWPTVVLQ